jgi:reducing polyketide synthase SwnK
MDVITDVPKDPRDADALCSKDPDAVGKPYRWRGGFIKKGVDSFDTTLSGISPREARSLDTAQSMMVETCWEAFERVGYTLPQLQAYS